MDGIRSVAGPADPVQTRRKSAGSSFAVPLGQTDASLGAGEVTRAEVGGLLLLQEHDVPEHRNRAARRRCDDLLHVLGELQLAMLAAGEEPELVARLAALAAGLPQAADPTLAALARMISLRATIEVARRTSGT
jgi:Class II flagellar assembly regulator